MTPEQARQELARREISRRQAENQAPQNPPQSQAGSAVQGGVQPLVDPGRRKARTLPPEMQAEINAQFQKDLDRNKGASRKIGAAIAGINDGFTLGGADHVAAAFDSVLPFGAARFGQYKDNLELARQRKDLIREKSGKTFTSGQIGGAVAGFGKVGAAKALPSQVAARSLGGTQVAAKALPNGVKGARGLAATTGAVALDGAAIAGAEAALNGRDVVQAAKQGGGIGAGLNVITRGLGSAFSPVAQNIKARFNPELMAQNQLVAALKKSGQSVDDIRAKFKSAKEDGADEFMIADALKEQGHSLASGVARHPGEGGQKLIEALNARQAGQSGRVVNALDDGFQTGGKTAAQATEDLSQTIRKTDRANFAAVPDEAVAPTSAMKFIQENTQAVQQGVKPTKAEKALSRYGEMISSASGSNNTQRMIAIRQDLADAADKAFRNNQGGLGTKLKDLKKAVDDDILAVSPAYREANAASSKLRGVRDQVKAGQTGAVRGRKDDLIQALQKASPEQRQAFATGFADKKIEAIQKARIGTNSSGALTGDKFKAISGELSEDGGDALTRKIDRENLMFETRNRAVGGSGTLNNLADQVNLNSPVGFGVQVARGDLPGAAGYIIRAGLNKVTGNNQNSRDALANMLLQNSEKPIVEAAAKKIAAGQKLSEAQQKAIVPLLAGGTILGNQ